MFLPTFRSDVHPAQREEYLQVMEEKHKTACRQTKRQYEIGQVPLMDVLTIQQKWTGAKIAKLDIAGKRLINRVKLHLALGGSFEKPSPSAAQTTVH